MPPSTPLTILMLLQHPQDETMMLPPSPPSPLLTLPHPHLIFSATYNPYSPTAPSTPLCLLPPTHYHPYACIVPSQHASNATLTLA
ncbi:hypothetical protein O181_019665 [Austropuccinia psidii MF-1]|uniref:Uncharacterized protein n=1 Tax=Austropuccinia psidii MF-1 TaxID=1389203 RepID=A0A9Q3GVA6_9BASI|nr:hypothetical protein [Austropuccinia psidii MF-1]